jgi:hypothetical protein
MMPMTPSGTRTRLIASAVGPCPLCSITVPDGVGERCDLLRPHRHRLEARLGQRQTVDEAALRAPWPRAFARSRAFADEDVGGGASGSSPPSPSAPRSSAAVGRQRQLPRRQRGLRAPSVQHQPRALVRAVPDHVPALRRISTMSSRWISTSRPRKPSSLLDLARLAGPRIFAASTAS